MASIYTSGEVSTKADIAVINPFYSYRDFEKDKAISNGYLYFGVVGRDGEVEENRKLVYAVLENGSALAIEQPVRLSAGGVPSYNGNPVLLAVNGSYSLKVKDSSNVQVYFAPKVVAKDLLGYSGVIPEEVKAKNGSTLAFDTTEATTATFYIADGRAPNTTFNGVLMQRDVDYRALDENTIEFISTYEDGSAVLGRMLDPTGQTVPATEGSNTIYLYDKQSDAIAANLPIGESVILNGKDALGDGLGGSYLVSSGGTADGLNIIDMDNGNQLHIKKTYQALKGIYESVSGETSSSGKFTLDASVASVFKLAMTENVSNIDILNIPTSGEVKIEIKVTQGATPYTLGWLINNKAPKAAGGTLPTLTASADAVDRYVILTDDGGESFEVYTAGQNLS